MIGSFRWAFLTVEPALRTAVFEGVSGTRFRFRVGGRVYGTGVLRLDCLSPAVV